MTKEEYEAGAKRIRAVVKRAGIGVTRYFEVGCRYDSDIEEMGLMLDAKNSVRSAAHAAAECRDRAIASEKGRDELIKAVRSIKELVSMKAQSAKNQLGQAKPDERPELKGEADAYDDVMALLDNLEGSLRP